MDRIQTTREAGHTRYYESHFLELQLAFLICIMELQERRIKRLEMTVYGLLAGYILLFAWRLIRTFWLDGPDGDDFPERIVWHVR